MHASLALEEQTVTHALRGSGASLRGDARVRFEFSLAQNPTNCNVNKVKRKVVISIINVF